jgi:acetolactate synthase-1/2/3 large subunit
MWAAQHFHFRPQQVADSAVWARWAMACPPHRRAGRQPRMLVIDIAGDASIQMNIQELGTATQFRLPVKIFILNNEWMGMVRQWQELTYESRYSSSYSDACPIS